MNRLFTFSCLISFMSELFTPNTPPEPGGPQWSAVLTDRHLQKVGCPLRYGAMYYPSAFTFYCGTVFSNMSLWGGSIGYLGNSYVPVATLHPWVVPSFIGLIITDLFFPPPVMPFHFPVPCINFQVSSSPEPWPTTTMKSPSGDKYFP